MTAPELPFYPITHDDGLSIVDALNDIADTQNSPSLIAEDFDETKNYVIGDYVIYSACLYRFVAPHSAGAWNSGHATQVRVGEELGEKASNSIVAPAFRSDWNYDVDDVVTYQGGLYRFITAHSAGDWNRSQVVTTNAISEGGGGGGGGGGGAGIGDVVTFDEHTMIVRSSERTLEPLESSIAIVANGDTHIAIDSGQYVYVKNHGALDEGLYIANSDIDENEELTASNLTKDNEGGLNSLKSSIDSDVAGISSSLSAINSNISAIDSSLAIVSNGDTHVAISSGEYVYVKNHGTLAEGLYTANSAIGANVALTTSNVTSVDNKGGLNKLNTKSINRVTDLKIVGKLITIPANIIYVSDVSAPSVSGYSFVGWVGTASHNWVGYVYAQDYTAFTTNFWAPGGAVGYTRDVNIYALYKKTAS